MVSAGIKHLLVSGCILTLWFMYRLFREEGGQAVFQQQCTCEQNCRTFSLKLPLLHVFPPNRPPAFSSGSVPAISKGRLAVGLKIFSSMGNFIKKLFFDNVLIMPFKTFYIFRGNEDLRNLTVCSISKKENDIPWSY